MTRAIATVNYSNFMAQNSRDSMQDAARRWGVEYFEYCEQTLPKWPDRGPNAMKTTVFRTTGFNEVMCVDADVIISGCCPNPFEAFLNEEEFVAVVDRSTPDCQRLSWDRHTSKRPDLMCELDHSRYFNTGFMVMRRKAHEKMMNFACDICGESFGDPWSDQTPIVISSILNGAKVNLVDERWNFLAVQRFPYFMDIGKHPEGPYCLHGAGDPSRIHWLHEVKWQL